MGPYLRLPGTLRTFKWIGLSREFPKTLKLMDEYLFKVIGRNRPKLINICQNSH